MWSVTSASPFGASSTFSTVARLLARHLDQVALDELARVLELARGSRTGRPAARSAARWRPRRPAPGRPRRERGRLSLLATPLPVCPPVAPQLPAVQRRRIVYCAEYGERQSAISTLGASGKLERSGRRDDPGGDPRRRRSRRPAAQGGRAGRAARRQPHPDPRGAAQASPPRTWSSLEPNRGARVRSYDPAELDDLYRLRAVLEGYAARRAAERIDADGLDALQPELRAVRPPRRPQARRARASWRARTRSSTTACSPPRATSGWPTMARSVDPPAARLQGLRLVLAAAAAQSAHYHQQVVAALGAPRRGARGAGHAGARL